jgi:hypothetical protein
MPLGIGEARTWEFVDDSLTPIESEASVGDAESHATYHLLWSVGEVRSEISVA